ncbi:MAG TPA: 5-formyltetrahydrofolate cyclo-ligase [Gammaproteobacteria bacterium]|nr:5-formyltetrahydrofolate cyclo-ligase [Gammaproteobacteria bacterium]
MPDDSTANKKSNADIRQSRRNERQSLAGHVQRRHSQLLCRNTVTQKAYRNARHIALYIASDGEIDPSALIEHARFMGKKLYLPVLAPLNDSLYFAPFESNSQLILNRYNIPEPRCHPSSWKTARQLDLLLVPLVAFDAHGNRIGMGGGFYDRSLAYLRNRMLWKKPTLIGLAHELQKVEQLNMQSWDIPLDCIITEERCYCTG